MKLLYFGTVCDLRNYECVLQNCIVKPSMAPQVFETALLSGFRQNDLEVDILSYPMIPSFPKSRLMMWGNRKEKLDCGYECVWLKTINIPVLKQISRRMNGGHLLKKWLKENAGQERLVLTYGMPPFLMEDIIRQCQKHGVKCVAVVTDLLRDMYMNERNSPLVARLKERYLAGPMAWQGRYDGYVYLTECMREVVNPAKPYVVMEGIADIPAGSREGDIRKAAPPAVMYAGALEEKFGILKLLDAFEQAELLEAECWLFGSGNAEKQIRARAEKNPRIRFMGRKKRDEILAYERKAALLVNPRSAQDVYTRYSFPSKTIEYMLSGTPLLTTKLPGIPAEYYPYLFLCEDNDPQLLKAALEKALALPPEQMEALGAGAKAFITENKNAKKQAQRLIRFFAEVVRS